MDLLSCDLPGIPKIRSGKVREIFDLGENLLLVATDRISAFDCVLPNPIPHKGEVLTQISAFWFDKLDFVPNHLVTSHFQLFPEALKPFKDQLAGRAMIARKAGPLPVECVARGFLAGSGWREYQENGTVCGHQLPRGLRQSDRLPETIFTPATKSDTGHDRNITWRECRSLLGDDIALQVRKWTIDLYEHGRAYAAQRGIIVADTKFEFGILDDEVILIDECLTPDSSRFWPEAEYVSGCSPPSFDKQFVRDYLEAANWDKQPPAPSLPPEIIARTSEKYLEAYDRLTGLKIETG
ncbi:MAG TPA: phosphoribosylaminoimidazolesuccinocarboxamide synthase [Terrimicrobiaceae bacterium]|nr:phosphoribosylaminoimidazolesuccinocarboxamide synthase [Terrimicrobiaceae bacterium]